ncbi:hypothetical protein EV196_105303 [Mariniflexile fucanivorans]|uniref:DUF6089 domain-containing protein n=1 Tax=Mariniflexile fucanivorans TaxID=264023 RepID=A0A4R1RHS1_9FLAO|nr:DUF6089 family protein [Mariniflexile fucanivorans]TCL65638.1 hypothetical protein EV196_105303 [Mariniflexile fucanivorans]
MRHLTILILSILTIQLSHSQINELGIFVGGSNFIGDVGATDYINPNSPTLGILYKWNRSPRHSWRVSLMYSDLKASDNKSDDPRRIQRDYKLDTNLLEISAGMEFTFMDFNLHSGHKIGTPYLYTGLSVANHQNYYFINGVQTSENNYSWAYGIPMVLGYKTNILGNIIIGAEVGARYTFSDEIDGSLPDSVDHQQYRFGNINNNDWYVFSGITLTYTFGIKPCYCVN